MSAVIVLVIVFAVVILPFYSIAYARGFTRGQEVSEQEHRGVKRRLWLLTEAKVPNALSLDGGPDPETDVWPNDPIAIRLDGELIKLAIGYNIAEGWVDTYKVENGSVVYPFEYIRLHGSVEVKLGVR